MRMIALWVLGAAGVAAVGFGVGVYMVNNVEHPAYRMVTADGAIEVRDYPPLVVAEVRRSGDRSSAVNAGFGPLAGYIFASDRSGDKIAMTAPVTQRRETIAMTAPVTQTPAASEATAARGAESWTVRFIMPSKYTLATLPKPASPDVTLSEVPAARRAAIRFPGVATDGLIAEQERRLRSWLEARGLRVVGPPTYAYYNAPFTPGPLRRNEVMLDLLPG